ncbi:MAG: PepSY domain-containing protein [Emcibacteraceae bacterium]|nr:PepSY domain-containing protein [Emcibacteraceae bacterium]
MSIREIIYWPHLICGIIAGVIILTLSASGVVLTYERQIISWAENEYIISVPDGAASLTIDTIAEIVKQASGNNELRSIKIENNPQAPVVVRADHYYYVNRYDGEILGYGPVDLRSFFSDVTSFHRWFLMKGDNRDVSRAIIGTSNLIFLFILLSGIYLWLPKVLKWANIRKKVFFHKTRNAHARDFNWHHVFGIWSVIPLVVIAATGTVFYYSWADSIVEYVVSEEDNLASINNSTTEPSSPLITEDNVRSSTDQLFAIAKTQQDEWQSITMYVPDENEATTLFDIDKSPGGQPFKIAELTLNTTTGQVLNWKPFSAYSPYRKARAVIRFLHTGETLGILGQTVAGLASLFACIMVWTGFTLAYRKYITPLFNKQ